MRRRRAVAGLWITTAAAFLPFHPSINFPNTFHQLFLLARGSGGLYPRTSPVAMRDFTFTFLLADAGRIYSEEIHVH
jgi:hypothetical protein